MSTRTVEYYRCWDDRTWDTDFIEIPRDAEHLNEAIETAAEKQQTPLETLDLDALEALWQEQKKARTP